MKITICLCILLISASAFSDTSFLKNKTVVGCEHEDGYPPFIFKNPESGKLEGYSIDVLNLVFKNSGAKVEYELLPWKRCLEYMTQSNRMDLVLTAASTDERREKYLFSDAFAEVHLAYFYDRARYPKGLSINNPIDLDNMGEVCGMRGWEYGDYGLSKKVWKVAHEYQQLIELVIIERCDVMLIRYEIFKNLPKAIRDSIYYNRMKGGIIPWRKDNPIKFYFMSIKYSSYHNKLVNFINNRLVQIRKSGKLRDIKEKYGFMIN